MVYSENNIAKEITYQNAI